jgi:carbon storage regulator
LLVLTRRNQESILIGDDIKITVLNIGRGQVRIGLEGPDDVLFLREEIADKFDNEGNRIDD